MKLNQKGLTLIELLGAMTLVCILGMGAFATLNNSLNLFQKETTRIDVRTQANIIANQLTTFYRVNQGFEIISTDDGVRIEVWDDDQLVQQRNYSLPGHHISIIREEEPTITSWEIDAKQNSGELISIIIRIEEINSTSEPFELKTTVSRLG